MSAEVEGVGVALGRGKEVTLSVAGMLLLGGGAASIGVWLPPSALYDAREEVEQYSLIVLLFKEKKRVFVCILEGGLVIKGLVNWLLLMQAYLRLTHCRAGGRIYQM